MVAPTKIIAGLGMSLGIDRLEAPGTTGHACSHHLLCCAALRCDVLQVHTVHGPVHVNCGAHEVCHDVGDYRTQFHAKAETIAEALSSGKYDFGFLHIKAVDDTGHDQHPVLKVW